MRDIQRKQNKTKHGQQQWGNEIRSQETLFINIINVFIIICSVVVFTLDSKPQPPAATTTSFDDDSSNKKSDQSKQRF